MAFANWSPEPILEDLNPAQKEAVLHQAGPLFILAGAGSGKTRVITYRVAHLMHQGHPPDSILAITFTNKAASEMKERTERLCGLKSPWISTFHSFCARILRRHIHRLPPYDNSFTIYDAEDSRALIKELLDELGIDPKLWTPRAVQEEISRIKNACVADVESLFGSDYLYGQKLRSIYHLYAERLRERNAADFDDLLLLLVRLLEENPDLLERLQEQFRHVLIDEFQDTNPIQYRIGKLLSSRHRNLCITGDPDQSIYKWRGADIANILNFEADYPDAKVVALEQNYRSTMNILHVANALIAHNRLRKPKSLWSEKPPGEPVRVYRFADEKSEAAEVAALVRGLVDEGTPLGDIAVFYRLNSLSRAVEQELIYANVPYSMVGGIEFFLRREVKDVIAYLRIIDNPRDAESLKRVLNVPARGLGPGSTARLIEHARAERRGLLDVILEGAGGARLGKKARGSVARFAEIYRQAASRRQGPVADLVRAVVELTGYEDFLRTVYGEESAEHIANVAELGNAAQEYDAAHAGGTLTSFLEMVKLLGDVDRWERRDDRLSLMTLHAAKGLEFPVVVIIGIEEGILPLLHASDSEPDEEEERRLLYVGMTRAKERLYLTHTVCRARLGRIRPSCPSRYLRELEPPGEEAERAFSRLEMDPETEESLSAPQRPGPRTREATGKGSAHLTYQDFAGNGWADAGDGWEADEDPYPVGSRVIHEAYGEGAVVRVTGIGSRRRVTVSFDDAGEKQFVLGIAPLKRIR